MAFAVRPYLAPHKPVSLSNLTPRIIQVIGTRLLKAFAPRISGMKSLGSSSAESEPMSVSPFSPSCLVRALPFLLTNISVSLSQWSTYARTILPIGVLFSSSLILSNSAVLLLSVSLVQMLKVRSALSAFAPHPMALADDPVLAQLRPSSQQRFSSSRRFSVCAVRSLPPVVHLP